MLQRRPFVRSLLSLIAGLVCGAVLSSLSGCSPQAAIPADATSPAPAGAVETAAPEYVANDDTEISPDDFAREMGLPLEEGQPFGERFGFSKKIPSTRTVVRENFKNYRVNLDIFRKSAKRPVLGGFRDEYTSALVPNADGMSADQRTLEAKKRFANLASREFAVASLDGIPFKAYIISAAVEARVSMPIKNPDGSRSIDPVTGRARYRMSMKTTPAGNYRLDPINVTKRFRNAAGAKESVEVAYPWLRSRTYHNSQMFWGLWIKGGYFIHSTPHYGELGRPASMGCIRQSYPDAQELFKLVVEEGKSAMVRIHKIGATESVSRLREVIVDLGYEAPADAPVEESPRDPSKDMNWLLAQLQANADQIRDSVKYYGANFNVVGHEWIHAETKKPADPTWPSCGDFEGAPIDCFKTHGVKKPKNSLN